MPDIANASPLRRKLVVAIVGLAAAAAAGSASASTVAAVTVVKGEPVRIKTPTRADLEGVQPDAAKAGGWVQLGCQVARDGSLKDCSVVEEHPKGSGFGQAAVRVTRGLHAGKVDKGRTPVGGVYVLPVIFGAAN